MSSRKRKLSNNFISASSSKNFDNGSKNFPTQGKRKSYFSLRESESSLIKNEKRKSNSHNLVQKNQEKYTINGIEIEFPFKAYPCQINMMDKVISILNAFDSFPYLHR